MQAWERIVDAVPDPLVLVDRRAVVVRANPAALRLLGVPASEIAGDAPPLSALVAAPFGDEAWSTRLVEAAYAGLALPLVTVDERRRHLEASVHPVGEGTEGPLLLRLHVVEESERWQILQQLEASYALLDTLFERAPIGLALFTCDLRYARINARLEAINGRPRGEQIGRRVSEVLGPAGLPLERQLRQVIQTHEPLTRLQVTSEPFGMPGAHTWEVSFYPVEAGGEVIGVGAVLEEITDRVAAEQERSRLLADAQAAVRSRDEFLSIASHELKTPLTPLWTRLAMLERALERGEPARLEQVRKARASLVTLTTLINDLLDASRIASGRMSVQLAPLELGELVERIAATGEREGHPIHVELPHVPVEVFGDPARIEQVLENLVDNAAKYSPAGSTIEVLLEDHGDRARIAVRDAGIGIPPDQHQHLFERYYRAPDARRVVAGGLGLGLYISRDIVERHGGSIGISSAPGQGSTFWVELPTTSAWHDGVASHHRH